MVEGAKIEFYRGDTYSRDFSVKGWGRNIDNVYFTVKENVDDKRYVLQKILNDGITVMDQVEDTITFKLSFCCTDTDVMKADKEYTFDIEIHSNTEDEVIKKTIIKGTMKVKASATKTCNER